MAGIAFGAETATPDIVFIHATGFNARTYRTLLQPLGERFHVLALDMRGHGLTTLPHKLFSYTSWKRHRDDLIAVLEHFTAPVTLAGHSMGATISLLTAGVRTDLVNGLALLEPVILPAAGYAFMQLPLAPILNRYSMPLARGAMNRRNKFASKEDAVTAFTGRGIFRTFPAEVIADYVGDGLIEDHQLAGSELTILLRPLHQVFAWALVRDDFQGEARRANAGAPRLPHFRALSWGRVVEHERVGRDPHERMLLDPREELVGGDADVCPPELVRAGQGARREVVDRVVLVGTVPHVVFIAKVPAPPVERNPSGMCRRRPRAPRLARRLLLGSFARACARRHRDSHSTTGRAAQCGSPTPVRDTPPS